jgi:hypothetical protein
VEQFDRIPDESAWSGYERDLDVRYLHERFFGKSHTQVQEYFGDGSSIERMDELIFSPRPVFQYYVQSFAMYVMSPAAAGDTVTASAFLSLLESRDGQDPGSVKPVYPLLAACVEFVADNFARDAWIYGSFRERCLAIASAYGAEPV